MKVLIEAGADVDKKGHCGKHLCTGPPCKGHAPVITELIKAGADVNATDDDGIHPTPLRDPAAEKRIASPCCSRTALMSTKLLQAELIRDDNYAVQRKYKKIIKMLKQAGG